MEPGSFRWTPEGDYSLREAIGFWQGFRPGTGTAHVDGQRLVLVFRRDGDFAPAGAAIEQRPDAELVVTASVPDGASLRAQLERTLSLDVDARGWHEILGRDPVLAALQAEWPGFRPVCFPSPWEAAVWGILAQRVPMAIAARIKTQTASAHGDRVGIAGASYDVFPSPRQVLDLERIDAVSAQKLEWLKGVARAALDGRLDAERLRALPIDAALAELGELPGVGRWTSAHILFRGAALADGTPFAEPRVRRAVALAYDLGRPPTESECARRAEAWRPFRMWACILLVRALARSGGWNEPRRRRS